MLNAGNFAFEVSNALAVVVALGLECTLLPGRSRAQIALAALVGYPLVITLTRLLVGAVVILVLDAGYFVMVPVAIVTILWIIVQRRNRPKTPPICLTICARRISITSSSASGLPANGRRRMR